MVAATWSECKWSTKPVRTPYSMTCEAIVILLLTHRLPLAPISGTDYANNAPGVCESNSEDVVSDSAEMALAWLAHEFSVGYS
jgi:hypothetical protein